MNSNDVLLQVRDLKKHYPLKKWTGPLRWVKAVDGLSFDLKKGETLGIVGESGCGKSTLAKVLMQIEPPTSGSVQLMGKNLPDLEKKELCQHIQMVFQDPYSSINPRKKAWQIIAEPLMIHTSFTPKECKEKAQDIMEKVGLSPSFSDRYPHMFSGGQRQRIGLARALIMHPQILCLDEPLSALDVSIQAQVINLLMDLQEKFELSYLFISHDLSVIKHLSDKVMVMYLGKVVEYASQKELFEHPTHPYTQALLESTPSLEKLLPKEAPPGTDLYVKGELPSPLNPPPGCAFHKRCPLAEKRCQEEIPLLESLSKDSRHLVACHLAKKEK